LAGATGSQHPNSVQYHTSYAQRPEQCIWSWGREGGVLVQLQKLNKAGTLDVASCRHGQLTPGKKDRKKGKAQLNHRSEGLSFFQAFVRCIPPAGAPNSKLK